MMLYPAGRDLELSQLDPMATPGWAEGKRKAQKALAEGGDELGELQEKLFAASLYGGKRSLLVVLQAMDTAGKGGIVRHAFRGADPAGVRSHAFKAPTDEEKRHDFLWRVRRQLPPPGYLGVFDRSHYEDVLIHRVHQLASPEVIEERYGAILRFEAELAASGVAIIKFMLQISPEEQRRRLLARLRRPDKRWKYNPADVDERELWAAYQQAYEIAIRKTSTADAPWFVVPADRKWYARLAVQRLTIERLRSLNLDWPVPGYDVEAEKARLARPDKA